MASGPDPNDRNRVAEYLDNVREIERRIQLAESRAAPNLEVPPDPSASPTIPGALKLLMNDVIIAFRPYPSLEPSWRRSDYRTFPQIGSLDPFHPTHHQNDPDKSTGEDQHLSRQALVAHLLERLSPPDSDGNLPVHSLISTEAHEQQQLHDHSLPHLPPRAGRIRAAVIKYPNTPMSNFC